MFSAIFIGLSGMNAYSEGLRQISNNITNVNSTGYKATDIRFLGSFGSSDGVDSGQGVGLAQPRLDFSQGELRQTDRDLDLAVEGNGFMVLLKDAEQFFSRTGSYEINPDGDIVLAGTSYKLTVVDQSGNLTPVSVSDHRTNPPSATTTISFADNLSSTSENFALSNVKVYDAQGEVDNWRVSFERTAASPAGEWTVVVKNGAGAEISRQTLKFINGIIDPATARLTVTDTAEGRSAVLDFSGNVTSFSSGEVSTLRVSKSDGFAPGDLTTVRVNEEGAIEAVYSNGQTKSLGAIAIADLRDQQAIEQRSNGLFGYSGSLASDFRTSADHSVGRVVSRRLEASNVDLAKEFGILILVQRGFQASSQVVSVSNDMIQQLFGIRGQG